MKTNIDGDYYITGYGRVAHWVILVRSYYPLVTEEKDNGIHMIFEGLSKLPQKRIFSLCIEGWI